MSTTESTDQATNAGLSQLLDYLDATTVPFAEFGCYAAVSRNRTALFSCTMLTDGSPERDEDHPKHMSWGQVTAPEREFVERVNSVFGTTFDWSKFPGR